MEIKNLIEEVCKTWDNFEASGLKPYLADDFEYYSVAVSQPIKGADQYLSYLTGKFETFKRCGISYRAEALKTFDNSFLILLKDNKEEQNPPVLQVSTNEDKIQQIVMRPLRLFTLQDLNDRQKFNQIILKACNTIHEWVNDKRKALNLEVQDLEWYQAWPYFDAPSFQHMCFRLGNNVYSLFIKLYGQFHTSEDGQMVELGNVSQNNQLRECQQNNLIACDMLLDINCLAEPTLCYAGEDRMIELNGGNLKDSLKMSPWEINAKGLNILLDYLHKVKPEHISYTNVLSFKPQLFYWKDEIKKFIYFDAHPAGIKVEPINIDQVKLQTDDNIKGEFANIGMADLRGNNGDFQDVFLYRRGDIISNFKGLIPIEEAEKEFGTVNKGAYSI